MMKLITICRWGVCLHAYLALGCKLNNFLLTQVAALAQLSYACITDGCLLLCQHLFERHGTCAAQHVPQHCKARAA